MFKRAFCLTLLVMALSSCGGDGNEPGGSVAESGSSDQSTSARGGLSRESFILCPALEPYRQELASIVGFQQDADRALAGFGMECIVNGDHGAFVRVAVPPAFTQSIAMHAQGYDAEKGPAPELGPDSVYVDAAVQPHVLFLIGPVIIDVDAESIDTPTRETMIRLALRVREILTNANS